MKPQEFGATYEAFLSYIHPDDRSAVDCAYSGSVLEGRDSYEIDHRVIRKDTGEIRFVHEKCTHVRNNEGKIIRSIGMVQDISDQKRIEDELRISEEKFSKAFMNSPNAITLTRLSDGKIIDTNNSVRKILGYELKDTKGRSTVELGIWINPNDRIDLQRKLQEQGFVDNQELVFRSKDGRISHC